MIASTISSENWIYKSLLFTATVTVLLHGSDADLNWYRGCYTLPFNGNFRKQPLRELSRSWSPERCAKKCLKSSYAYAYLTSTTSCFCLGALTRKVHKSICNYRCPLQTAYSCGGTRTASVYSVYGPYILKYEVTAKPLIARKYQDISLTVNIELGHDSSTRSGIPSIDSKSFRRAEILIPEGGDMRPKSIDRVVSIIGRKGQVEITLRYATEGPKILDVEITNPISTVAERLRIDVESRMPSELKLWTGSGGLPSVCNPDTTGEIDGSHNTIFVGEPVMFWARVQGGYNLTFNWDFCGRQDRIFVVDIQNPTCQLIFCKEDMQKFRFDSPGQCTVKVEVSNSFGSTSSSMLVTVVSPEYRDLKVEALPYEWEWERTQPSLNARYDTFAQFGNIHEGETNARDVEDRSYRPGHSYDIVYPPFPTEQPKVAKNHIALASGQYLLEKAVHFRAVFFMNNMRDSTNLEIDLGDGDGLQHTFHPTDRFRRKKRDIKDKDFSGLYTKGNLKSDVHDNDPYVKNNDIYLLRLKRRVLNPTPMDPFGVDFGPFDLPYQPEEQSEYESYDEENQNSNGIKTEYGHDCRLEVQFWHPYKDPGVYSVTLRVFDDNRTLFGGIKSPIHVLNGTAELNIRCPKAAELGKSVIFLLSSISDHQGPWMWKILQNATSQWIQDEQLSLSAYSLKRSFLQRGFYRIEVNSVGGKLASDCILQVEEALSELTVTTDRTFIQTGRLIDLKISLESGSDVTLEVFSEETLIEAEIHAIGDKEWAARFKINEANCYELYVRATNPISTLKSDFVFMCAEESISGLRINIPKHADLNQRIPAVVGVASGSNVSVGVTVLSLSNIKLAIYKRILMSADERVSLLLPPLAKSGKYRIIAHAQNNVLAKRPSCNQSEFVEGKKTFLVSNHIPWDPILVLSRWRISRDLQSRTDNKMGTFIYTAKIKGNPHGAIIGDGILYMWSLKQSILKDGKSLMKVANHHSSSPLFTLSLDKCSSIATSLKANLKTTYVAVSGGGLQNKCQVGVTLKTLTGYHAESAFSSKDISRLLVIPQSGVIEVGKSCEFDIKCPVSTSGMCLVKFGDGSEPMRITSNSNMKSLSHAFTETGLHRISLTELGLNSQAKQILYVTQVLVQEKISSVKLQGTSYLSHGITSVGSWRVASAKGTNKVYKWSIGLVNGITIASNFSREEEYSHSFMDSGEYIVRVVVYNDINQQTVQKTVNVEDTPWFFNVKTNRSVLGRPSSFIISTNASNNVVSATFQNSSKVVKFDLSCLRPNGSYLDKNNMSINWYVITFTYNETGLYEATFSLLSKIKGCSFKNLYTVKTEVIHKPEPKKLEISIISQEAVQTGGKRYVPTNQEITMQASTNYDTEIFSWKIWHLDGPDQIILLDTVVAANHSSSLLHYKFENSGRYNVLAIAHPEQREGNKTVIEIEAEDVITKVWVHKPFSYQIGDFVEDCILKKHMVSGSIHYECDSLTLTASSFGTHVTFFFHICFREDIPGNYTAPTEVIDVIKPHAKQTTTKEASVQYNFKRYGVYSIFVIASNHLGNKSAEIPYEKPVDGPPRPFLFFAQRPIEKFWFKDVYHVAPNQLATFEVHIGNEEQFIDIKWDMGDGTELTGISVQHSYDTAGSSTITVVASNRVDKQVISTIVSVETPITSVRVKEMPHTYSTTTSVRFQASVQPELKPEMSAISYTWHIGNTSIPSRDIYNHEFLHGGMYSVKVVASNAVSSAESKPITVEVQEEIVGYFVGDNVALINKSTLLEIELMQGSNVTIQWMIDDLELRDDTFILNYTFTKVGVYYVRANLKNKLGPSIVTVKIFVVDALCQIPNIAIAKNFRRAYMVTRSKPMQLEVDVDLDCSFLPQVLYDWKVWKLTRLDNDESEDMSKKVLYDIGQTAVNGKVLEVPPRILTLGNYSIEVNVTINGTILYQDAAVKVDVYPSELVAKIDGGKIQYLNRDDKVTLDASLSYDPDHPDTRDGLKFQWECFVLFTPGTPCFKKEYLEATDSFVATKAPTTQFLLDNMRAMDAYVRNTDASHERISIPKNHSAIAFDANWLMDTKESFVFRVKVTSDNIGWVQRSAVETVVVKLSAYPLEWLKIECKNCKNNKVANQVSLEFHASCPSCDDLRTERFVEYEWSMFEVVEDRSPIYKNETSHCAPNDGEGWLSLKGFFGNASDLNLNLTTTDQDLLPGLNFSHEHLEENSNFVGKITPEEELRKPYPENAPRTGSNSAMSDDVKEGDSDFRGNGYRRQETTPSDNAPYPIDHTRPVRSSQYSYDIVYQNSLRERGGNGQQETNEEDQNKEVSKDVVEAPSSNSRFSGKNIPEVIPTLSPRPRYLTTPPLSNGYRDDSAVDNDLQSAAHYQDSEYHAVNLKRVAKGVISDNTLVLQSAMLSQGKTYHVKVRARDKDEESLIGQASYYFSVLRGPIYGICSILYRIESYVVHCADWKNHQNDNMKDVVSQNQILHYDVKYSLNKDGFRRHIYSGIKNELNFNLPFFDKPAYVHIALINADGARTEVCSFQPEGPDTYVNSTDYDYLEDTYNKSVAEGNRMRELIATGDYEGIIALSYVILDTLPNVEFFEENIFEIDSAKEIIHNIILALSSIHPRNIPEMVYIVDAITRALSRIEIVGINSFFKASELIVNCAEGIKRMKRSTNPTWQMDAIDDEQMMNVFINARLRLTQVCRKRAEQLRGTKTISDKEKLHSTSQAGLLQYLFETEKKTYASLNTFLLSRVENRPIVVGPLYTMVGDYGFVAQHLGKTVRIPDGYQISSEDSMPWNMGAVIPDSTVEKLKFKKEQEEFYAVATTMPDIRLPNHKMSHIDGRHLTLSLHGNDFSEIKVSHLPDPITIALPPREQKLIQPLTGLLSRDHVTINRFTASRQHNRTLHIEVLVEAVGNRSFPVTVAITKEMEEWENAPRNEHVIGRRVLTRGQLSSGMIRGGGVVTKFTMRDNDFIDGHQNYQVVIWNEQSSTGRSRRFDDRHIPYTLKIWWSDCYYWNELVAGWRQDGVKVLEESTSMQTLCATSHLSSFSASFIPIRIGSSGGNNHTGIHNTGFFAAFVVLILLLLVIVLYLRVTHGYKCRESFFEMSRLFRPKFNAVGRRLRWYFGPDQKSTAVPVILHDNRKEHKQIYELLMQTSCWPGSGTTSNVCIKLYGKEGQYEARELITPKTHGAREARYENGFAEDDDCTGINDELFITGALTKFLITFPENKGDIEKISLWHDHSGEFPDWKVDYITIRDVTLDRRYHFSCYNWIAIGKGNNSHAVELKPISKKPSFQQQIALKVNAYLCNFSSICALIASPAYGNLTRPQRAVHLMSSIVVICALSIARFWMEWDLFFHDNELPYFHSSNAVYGMMFGVLAAVICLPAQLIFRFSKQEDMISVTIEDATESLQGSGFLGEYYANQCASSFVGAKTIDGKQSQSERVVEEAPPNSKPAVLSSMECDYIQEDNYDIPSVEEAVCDWLVSKADSEGDTADTAGSNKSIDKDWNLPGGQSSSQPKWRQSVNSIDEEIARCMMPQAPLKRTHRIVEKDASVQQIDTFDEAPVNAQCQKLPAPIQGENEIFSVSARLKKELDSMLQSGSLLAEQYAQMEGIYSSFGSNLEIPPEIVPCEKLEPIPRDFGALLPKKCRKIAWIYSACVIIIATVFTLWGSAQIYSHDVIPWLETAVFSFLGLTVVCEGLLILVFAVFKSIYDVARWKMSLDSIWNLLDNVFCVSHFSTMMKNSSDFYIGEIMV